MIKKILALFVLISINSFAQTFTTGSIEQGNGSSNIIGTTDIGSDGKFYSLFNDGVFTHTSNNLNPIYRLVRWEPGTSSWTSIANIDAANIPGAIISSTYTMFNDGLALEIDSSGGYHILMNVYTSNGLELKYAYSSNGTSWSYTTIDHSNNQTNYDFYNLQLKLDNTNKPHVYYLIRNIGSGGISSKVYSIIHKYHNGTGWISETAYSQTGGNGTGTNAINMMSASIDGNNKSHIAFIAETNGSGTDASLIYTTNSSGSWSSPAFLATGSTGNAAADCVNILCDSNNKAHITYRQNGTSLKLFYTTNKSGSWVNGQINSNLTSGIMPTNNSYNAFTINASNDLFLAYNASASATNTGQVNYACLFNGSTTWQTGTVFTGNSRTGQYISAEFDNSKKAMITFDHFTDPASTGGSPSYGPPNNPRQLQFATTTVNNLSVDDFLIKNNITIYPNPTNSLLFVEYTNLTNVSIQILDLNGKVLETKSNSTNFDLSNFPTGTYLMKINSSEGSETIKILKK
jgi:hypothetical protein